LFGIFKVNPYGKGLQLRDYSEEITVKELQGRNYRAETTGQNSEAKIQ
jgi:hypothetical protein